MKKLNLSLDDLQVESFGTTPTQADRGTVRGNSGCCYSGTDCTEHWSTCDTYGDTELGDFCPVTGQNSCGDSACTCSDAPETCDAQCPFSYHTDCHRC
jgi:hypothetical protein